MRQNILLLGKDGQLGGEFARFFISNTGCNVDVLGHGDIDIADKRMVFDVVKRRSYSTIINCTAYNNVDLAEKEKEVAFKVNFIGVRNLAEAAQKNHAKLIHFSTDYIFDGKQTRPYCIYDSPNPLSIYGKSKLYGEKAIKEITSNYLIIRVSWVFGGANNFITKLIKWSRQSNKLEIIQDQISSPTYTYDLVRAVYNLINKDLSGTFHITNTPVKKIDWAKYILNKINWSGQIIGVNLKDVDFKAARPRYAILDNFLYNSVVNVEMPSWEDATDRFLE